MPVVANIYKAMGAGREVRNSHYSKTPKCLPWGSPAVQSALVSRTI